jgi:hypothetical protein
VFEGFDRLTKFVLMGSLKIQCGAHGRHFDQLHQVPPRVSSSCLLCMSVFNIHLAVLRLWSRIIMNASLAGHCPLLSSASLSFSYEGRRIETGPIR